MKREATARRRRDRTGPRRAAGTRARAPSEDGEGSVRAVVAITGTLALLAAVGLAPRTIDAVRVRLRAEPFLLERVAVRGLERLSADGVAAIVGLGGGVPLVDVDPDAVAARLARHPWVADATVLRWPPATLLVGVRERQPLAVTRAGTPPALHVVDATGTAFAPAGPADAERLVEIVLAQPPAVGEPDPRLAEALALAASLDRHGLAPPRRVALGLPDRDASAELHLRGLAPAVRLERSDPDDALQRLASLLAAGLPGTASTASIDLRFADRAVLAGGSWGAR